MNKNYTIDNLKVRIGALWEKTEKLIIRFFDVYNDWGNGGENALPKMTDFNVIVAAIKRMQEARLELLKEESEDESLARTGESDTEGIKEDLSRLLDALEKNGGDEASDPDALPD